MKKVIQKAILGKENIIIFLGTIFLFVLVVLCAMLFGIGNSKNSSLNKDDSIIEIDLSEASNSTDTATNTNIQSDFETDFMNDLEGLFNKESGYENIEGDFGFIAPDAQ